MIAQCSSYLQNVSLNGVHICPTLHTTQVRSEGANHFDLVGRSTKYLFCENAVTCLTLWQDVQLHHQKQFQRFYNNNFLNRSIYSFAMCTIHIREKKKKKKKTKWQKRRTWFCMWYTYSTVWLLHGWCHAKLLPSTGVPCTLYNHVVWCTQNTPRLTLSGSRFLWHQPCQRCKYITPVDIQKCAIKNTLFTHVELHVSAVSLRQSGE